MARRAALIDHAVERRREIVDELAVSIGFRLCSRDLPAPGILLQVLDPVLALLGEKFVERDEDRRFVVLAGLDGEHAALGGLDREAHDRLVDRADLLDIERPVGQALALARRAASGSSALRGCAAGSHRRR